jgi:hypothetical protein
MAASREKRWRDKMKDKLVKAGYYKAFNERQQAYRNENKCNTHKAWVVTIDEMGLTPTWKEFLAAENEKVARYKRKRAEMAIVKKPKAPDNKEELLEVLDKPDAEEVAKVREEEIRRERELVQNTIPDVEVLDDGIYDPLRDAQWVYRNMNRLFKVDKVLGIERLNENVLAEAPSNAAIGLAAHALRDKSKFYERYGLKLLQQRDEADDADDDEELLASNGTSKKGTDQREGGADQIGGREQDSSPRDL